MRRGGNADGLDEGAEGEGALQLQDGHVVVGGRGVVRRRDNYGLDVHYFGADLTTVSLAGSNQSCPLFGVIFSKTGKIKSF